MKCPHETDHCIARLTPGHLTPGHLTPGQVFVFIIECLVIKLWLKYDDMQFIK